MVPSKQMQSLRVKENTTNTKRWPNIYSSCRWCSFANTSIIASTHKPHTHTHCDRLVFFFVHRALSELLLQVTSLPNLAIIFSSKSMCAEISIGERWFLRTTNKENSVKLLLFCFLSLQKATKKKNVMHVHSHKQGIVLCQLLFHFQKQTKHSNSNVTATKVTVHLRLSSMLKL